MHGAAWAISSEYLPDLIQEQSRNICRLQLLKLTTSWHECRDTVLMMAMPSSKFDPSRVSAPFTPQLFHPITNSLWEKKSKIVPPPPRLSNRTPLRRIVCQMDDRWRGREEGRLFGYIIVVRHKSCPSETIRNLSSNSGKEEFQYLYSYSYALVNASFNSFICIPKGGFLLP